MCFKIYRNKSIRKKVMLKLLSLSNNGTNSITYSPDFAKNFPKLTPDDLFKTLLILDKCSYIDCSYLEISEHTFSQIDILASGLEYKSNIQNQRLVILGVIFAFISAVTGLISVLC